MYSIANEQFKAMSFVLSIPFIVIADTCIKHTLALYIFYSGIKYTEKVWLQLKVQHYPLQCHDLSIFAVLVLRQLVTCPSKYKCVTTKH